LRIKGSNFSSQKRRERASGGSAFDLRGRKKPLFVKYAKGKEKRYEKKGKEASSRRLRRRGGRDRGVLPPRRGRGNKSKPPAPSCCGKEKVAHWRASDDRKEKKRYARKNLSLGSGQEGKKGGRRRPSFREGKGRGARRKGGGRRTRPEREMKGRKIRLCSSSR